MGVTEEAGGTARGFINALGTQPVLLVQSLIIAGVVFILYAQGTRAFTEREQLLKSVFDAETHVREILSKCIVPPGGWERKSRAPYLPLPPYNDIPIKFEPKP